MHSYPLKRGLRPLLATVAICAAALCAAPLASAATCPVSGSDPYAYTPTELHGCGIATFPRASLAQRADGSSTSVYHVGGLTYTYTTPPPGFQALTASASDLARYHIAVSRPTGVSTAQWRGALARLHVVTPPAFLAELTNVTSGGDSQGSASGGAAGDYNTTNWSGWEASPQTFNRYNLMYGLWNEPNFIPSPCTPNASEVTWSGLGGDSRDGDPNHELEQAGTMFQVPGGGNHQSWTEIWPQQGIVPQNLYATAKEPFAATVQQISGGVGFVLFNWYTGNYISPEVTGVTSDFDGREAEVIGERPSVNGALTNLSDFTTLAVTEDYVNNQTRLAQLPHNQVNMNGTATSNVLAEPGPLQNNSGTEAFNDQWYHCR
jgi:hypothetical protein